MTALTQAELDHLPEAERKQVAARGLVECPKCRSMVAWLGDQGACVHLYGECLTCLLFTTPPNAETEAEEAEADAQVAAVIRLREEREQWTGRRVFPCPSHLDEQCPVCKGMGWILGYPPGMSPRNSS